MSIPFDYKQYIPRVKAAWEAFREIIPPCTERDEKIHFAKHGQRRADTEMSAFGPNVGGEGQEEVTTTTTFDNDDDDEGKMNGGFSNTADDCGFFHDADLEACGDEFGTPAHRISEWQAGWNVTNAIQGMFIVSLPFAVKNGGYWGIFAMVFVAYICCHTGKILVECLYERDERGQMARVRTSYVAIAEECFGRRYGGKIVHAAQMIELLMTCILYVVLCGDLMLGGFPETSIDELSWMMLCGMFLLPCAFLRSLRSVSFLSFWNTVAHLVINVVIIGYCVTRAGDWAFGRVQIRIDIYTFPISMGIVVFSYTSHIFLPTLEGSLRDRSRFNAMLEWSHLAAALFKAIFAYVAFLVYADDTDDVITNNLSGRGFKTLVNLILVAKALLSYPLPFYAAVDLLESSFFRGRPSTLLPSCYALDGMLKVWSVALRLALVFFTIMMAISIPHFAILMGFIGSFTGTMLSFVWPAYFHLRLKWDTLQWYTISLDAFIICLGGVVGSIGIYYSGRALKKAYRIKIPHMII